MRSRLRISPILAAPVPAKVQSLNILATLLVMYKYITFCVF